MERDFCPKCGYQRQPADALPFLECPRCGIVFAKYAQHLADRAAGVRPPASANRHEHAESSDGEPTDLTRLWRALFDYGSGRDTTALAGEAAVLLGLLIWGAYFIGCDWREGEPGQSFLHRVNLPFHEFGHILFRPFGQWLMFLGGSLFQCLMPLLLAGVFVFRERKPFGGAVCLWWVGQNLIDVAPYIGDATAMDLPLTGEWNDGVAEMREFRHDWHNILEPLGMLSWDARLATLAHGLGALIMLLAYAWAAHGLWQGWQARER